MVTSAGDASLNQKRRLYGCEHARRSPPSCATRPLVPRWFMFCSLGRSFPRPLPWKIQTTASPRRRCVTAVISLVPSPRWCFSCCFGRRHGRRSNLRSPALAARPAKYAAQTTFDPAEQLNWLFGRITFGELTGSSPRNEQKIQQPERFPNAHPRS